ncbi:MAG: sulfotransferase family protein [Candidatus Marinimicrobia bacterium]|nr:sulfotransferase family protein [Candidatus Neomarinimicrobiota bacterium]|tara:strand:- start:14823 stop:15563 length:741 start_codon:yes stop_codon:yes gene_type:complete
MNKSVFRIAMWSGPRNISTSLMRSWESRGDTIVTDEPLYGYYLLKTGANHPMKEEVIQSQETDWRKVAKWLNGPVENGKVIWYQKHMAQHVLPGMDINWISGFNNCFLIREPKEVLASYFAKRQIASLDEVGYRQQVELLEFEKVRTDNIPPVLDCKDILENPEKLITLLCQRLGITFTKKMLSWSKGRRITDGIWGKHWYDQVEKSTQFLPYRRKKIELPQELREVYKEAKEYYDFLKFYCIKSK